jgi:hypothetical protein
MRLVAKIIEGYHSVILLESSLPLVVFVISINKLPFLLSVFRVVAIAFADYACLLD